MFVFVSITQPAHVMYFMFFCQPNDVVGRHCPGNPMAVVTSCWSVLEELGYSHKCVGSGKTVQWVKYLLYKHGFRSQKSHFKKVLSGTYL